MSVVIALDFGTTRVKGGRLDTDGSLREVIAHSAPPLTGVGDIRESPPDAYLAVATRVRDEVCAGLRAPVRLGVASQRSSFTIWDTRSGEPRLPLISWQDRRAAAWCREHVADRARVRRLTGLLLSPHYVGPKLASLLATRRDLADGLAGGELRVGTLESWILWRWSGGRAHETDATMAARTLMAHPRRPRWRAELLDLFGVPASGLPTIATSGGRVTGLDGGLQLAASLGDQPASALAALGVAGDGVLVNLGTGGFVLRPTGDTWRTCPGYLSGPLLVTRQRRLFALEGTINGAGALLDRVGAPPTDLPATDRAPDAFALPDDAGVGAPHWIAERGLTLSAPAERLDTAGRRRILAEGIVFRVREIVEGLGAAESSGPIRLAGGLTRDPFFAPALAACLDRVVEVVDEPEQTLRGAAWVAAGCPPALAARGRARAVLPAPDHRWLRDKYPRWRQWLTATLGGWQGAR